MQGNPINENDKRNQYMAHYKKINIFGNSNVGKSTLILSIEKYLEKDFKIGKKEEEKSEENNTNNENNINNNDDEYYEQENEEMNEEKYENIKESEVEENIEDLNLNFTDEYPEKNGIENINGNDKN